MFNYYELSIISIILKKFKVNNIVISGMPEDMVTNQIFNYCDKNDVPYTVIDSDDLEMDYINDYSLNILPNFKDFDAIFLNDDPNWYTVYNELKVINENNNEFPLVFICHNIFPHKRRDSYINPEIIPQEFRKDNSKYFNHNNIIFQDEFYHANEENTPKNGVLTAIEDFLKENMSIGMMDFKLINGIVILYPKNSISQIRLGALSEEIEDYLVEYTDLEDNIVENNLLTNHISKFNLDEKLDVFEDFEGKLDEKNKLIREYEQKIKLHDEEMLYKNSKIEGYESKLDLKDVEILNVKSKLVNNDNEINELNEKLYVANNQVNNLRFDITQNFRNEISEYNDKLEEANSQIDSLKLRISKKEEEKSNLTKQLNNANDQISGNIRELSIKNDELIKKDYMLDSIKHQYTAQLYKLDNKEYCISCYKEEIANNQSEIQYLKKDTLTRKIFSPFAYLYLIFKSNPKELKLNFKLYRALKNSNCFNVGYYLSNNVDLQNSIWCKFFSPELHYICNGFIERRKFNKKYFNTNSKRELLDYILKCP